MLNRAVVQPEPVQFLGTAADIMQAATAATTADDVFFRLEEAGVMLRIDRSVTPTMAKVPTLAQWELDRLRTVDRVVRLGHLRHVRPGRLELTNGEAPIARDAVVVHCAAPGLRYPPLVPIWGREAITLQPIRITFACFGAALAGLPRGHARGRCREEPALPAGAVLQHHGRLGAPAGPRQSRVVLCLVSGDQGLGRRDLAEPGTHPTGVGWLRRRQRRPGAAGAARGTGLGQAGAARRDGVATRPGANPLSRAWS